MAIAKLKLAALVTGVYYVSKGFSKYVPMGLTTVYRPVLTPVEIATPQETACDPSSTNELKAIRTTQGERWIDVGG